MNAKIRDLIITTFLAILLGLVISGLMILLLGKNPLTAFSVLFTSMFRDRYTIGEIFVKATPLIFTGLAFAFTFKASLFNIGAQGQFYIGAVVAASLSLKAPYGFTLILLILLVPLAGGLWGSLIGYAKARFSANEFLISMMSTYVALAIMNYLLRTHLMEAKGEYPQTDSLARSVWLPVIFPKTRLHLGFIIAVLVAVFIWLLLYRTRFGFRVRAVGMNSDAAYLSGIKPGRLYVASFFISGALAGMAGLTEVNGVQHMLVQGFNPEIGSIGIGIAILANAHPIGIIFASILFGALQVGGTIMGQRSGIPSSIINLMHGFVMVFVIVSYAVRHRLSIRRDKRRLQKEAFPS
jgi:simple sugar transport system permease protein